MQKMKTLVKVTGLLVALMAPAAWGSSTATISCQTPNEDVEIQVRLSNRKLEVLKAAAGNRYTGQWETLDPLATLIRSETGAGYDLEIELYFTSDVAEDYYSATRLTLHRLVDSTLTKIRKGRVKATHNHVVDGDEDKNPATCSVK
ncbi:MAG: hypothetical protein ACK5Y2_04785 [Bdellovibrionales bacterium]